MTAKTDSRLITIEATVGSASLCPTPCSVYATAEQKIATYSSDGSAPATSLHAKVSLVNATANPIAPAVNDCTQTISATLAFGAK